MATGAVTPVGFDGCPHPPKGQSRLMSRTRVMIDGYNLNLETGTGVATYARNLSYCVRDLGDEVDVLYGTRAAPSEKLLREIAFFDPFVDRPGFLSRWAANLHSAVSAPFSAPARSVPITGKVITKTYSARMPYFDRLWNAPALFDRANRHFDIYKARMAVKVPSNPQIAHWTYPLPIKVPGAKNIYTIHDLVPLRLPYTTLDIKRRYYKLVKNLARNADHIVTVSDCSKRDIVNLLDINPDKVTTTYQAVEIPEKYADKPDDVVSREVEGTFNLPYKGYMLFFGAIEPKKNVGRLIEAYLASKIDTPLVIVGKLAWKSEQETRLMTNEVTKYLEQVNNFTVTRYRIQHIDYAPFALLVSLIKGAKAVLFPSLYEGFGLPALEAMLLGTPVMTSTEGSMPEIVGDGAIMVDPYDVRAMSEAIRALDSDAELRGHYAAKGRSQARLFSHEVYQKRVGELYRRLVPAT
jgi:glycosyltransferase involved in cell wall biosynthesis